MGDILWFVEFIRLKIKSMVLFILVRALTLRKDGADINVRFAVLISINLKKKSKIKV